MDLHGNWITGINTLDSYLLGVNQADLPSDVLNNKARNTYFFTSFNFWFNRIFIRFQKRQKDILVDACFFLFYWYRNSGVHKC